MYSKLKFTAKCLMENRLRFFLTVLSITVAVASVLLIGAVSRFGVSAVWAELDSLGMNGLIVTSENGSLGNKEVDTLGSINGVDKAAPVTVDASKVFVGSEETNAMIWGIDENAEDVVSFELLYGRFIDKGDIAANKKVCMVDQSLAVELYGHENIVGRSVDLLCSGAIQSFSVVGVVKTGKGIMQSLMGNYFPAFLYAPYTAFHTSPDYTQVFLKTDGNADSEAIGRSVKQKLGSGTTVADLAGQKGALESMLGVVTNILTVIGGISLLVSGISIMNIMLISVGERTKEIGIKRSIGAAGSDIMLDFLLEAVIIALAGTAMGIAIASAIAIAASIILHAHISVTLSSMALAVAAALVLGIIFGIFPAYKASRFKPVDALRR